MAEMLAVPVCLGCTVYPSRHMPGFIDPFNVIHWRERRWSRAGSKRFLMMVAKRTRLLDERFLNIPRFDWLYVHGDAVSAQRMAGELGFRIPAHLFDADRERCRYLARKRGIHLSNWPAIYAWAYSPFARLDAKMRKYLDGDIYIGKFHDIFHA